MTQSSSAPRTPPGMRRPPNSRRRDRPPGPDQAAVAAAGSRSSVRLELRAAPCRSSRRCRAARARRARASSASARTRASAAGCRASSYRRKVHASGSSCRDRRTAASRAWSRSSRRRGAGAPSPSRACQRRESMSSPEVVLGAPSGDLRVNPVGSSRTRARCMRFQGVPGPRRLCREVVAPVVRGSARSNSLGDVEGRGCCARDRIRTGRAWRSAGPARASSGRRRPRSPAPSRRARARFRAPSPIRSSPAQAGRGGTRATWIRRSPLVVAAVDREHPVAEQRG